MGPIIYWLRQDLRLSDNPALLHAVQSGRPVIPVFVHDQLSPGLRAPGGAQKWWLHHSLVSLQASYRALGTKLIIQSGAAEDVLFNLIKTVGASAICWNRRYGEAEQAVDSTIKSRCKQTGIEATSHAALLMHEPSLVRTGQGNPFKVYTPFWKAFCAAGAPRLPLPKPDEIKPFDGAIASLDPIDLNLLPQNPDWSAPLANIWKPGEQAAHESLGAFIKSDVDDYSEARDMPGPDRTSRLSPHLRFGEISPHQLWHATFTKSAKIDPNSREKWRKELVWREFSYHLLQHWPHLAEENFQPKFDAFPWRTDPDSLKAWQKGQTGYPIVDAGMRQLWQTGWMHNRVRMIVGSFLVKHLLIDWRHGEKWFWDTLVDGDPASNTASWQWVAGTGADAAPYFRIFSPIMQAEKFDKEGEYIRRFVPELKALPAQFLPAPWEAPQEVLSKAGVQLGITYPLPIVDHKFARERALEALAATKQSDGS